MHAAEHRKYKWISKTAILDTLNSLCERHGVAFYAVKCDDSSVIICCRVMRSKLWGIVFIN